MNYWLIVTTPAGVYGWNIDDPDDDARAGLVDAARIVAGFPPIDHTAVLGYDVLITTGEPHPDVLKKITVRDLSELTAVTRPQIDAYRVARPDLPTD